MIDGDITTSVFASLETEFGYPTDIVFNMIDHAYYAGIYILSEIKDYTVEARDAATGQYIEMCSHVGPEDSREFKSLTVCEFKDSREVGKGWLTEGIRILPRGLYGGSVFRIMEVWPIYAGDDFVEL